MTPPDAVPERSPESPTGELAVPPIEPDEVGPDQSVQGPGGDGSHDSTSEQPNRGSGPDRLVLGLGLLVLPAYLLFTAVANVVLFVVNVGLLVVSVPRTVWRRVVGKAVVQKQLEGRILAAKQDVLRIALYLHVEHGPGANGSFTPAKVEAFKQAIGYREGASKGRFGLWLPGRGLLDRGQSPSGESRRDDTHPTSDGSQREHVPSHEARARREAALEALWQWDISSFVEVVLSDGRPRGDGPPTNGSPAEVPDVTRGGNERPGGLTGRVHREVDRQVREAVDRIRLLPAAPTELSRDVLWAYVAMDLLNQAEARLQGNTETALRAYLRAERLIVAGEYLLARKQHDEAVDHSEALLPANSVVRESSPLFGPIGELYRRPRDAASSVLGSGSDAAPSIPGSGSDTDPDSDTDRSDTDDLIRAHARSVLDEMDEYDGTEREVVRELLCDEADTGGSVPELNTAISLAELDMAMGERNRFRMKRYRQIESLRVTILAFAGLPALLLGVLLVFFPTVMGDILLPPGATDVSSIDLSGWITPVSLSVPGLSGSATVGSEQLFFGLVLAFGALGAAISGAQKIEHDSGALRDLEEILGHWLALVRMVIGTISAFIVSIFLFSGIIDPELLSLAVVLGISLAAGFSERLVLRAISTFEARALSNSDSDGDSGSRTTRRKNRRTA